MPKATYYTYKTSRVLEVISKNPDGTVNLGNEKREVEIAKCQVSKDGKLGTCVLIEESTPAKLEKKDK